MANPYLPQGQQSVNPWVPANTPPFPASIPGTQWPVWPYSIPARFVQREEDPALHCNLSQVQNYLAGVDLSILGPQSVQTGFVANVMQEVTNEVCMQLRTSFDWRYKIDFYNATGSNTLVLPERSLWDVLQCIIRVLPSNTWYHFVRCRNVDGTEYFKSLATGIAKPESYPPGAAPSIEDVIQLMVAAAETTTSYYPTGIEDTDLYVDRRRRTIKIPPRVLYANMATPMWNYDFIPGAYSIEVHATYGYPPLTYTDGTPLQFNPAGTGATDYMVIPQSPATDTNQPGSPIDWSSGMPTGITMKVAKLVANRVKRQVWQAVSQGLSSMSVDGASESYGGAPYGGDLDKDDEKIMRDLLGVYGVQMVV